MSPDRNGGFTTFVLSTDDNALYEPDKRLLSAVCNRGDADAITDVDPPGLPATRRRGRRRPRARAARTRSTSCRRSPVTCRSRSATAISACRSRRSPGSFELTPDMLTYYGTPIDGSAETALAKGDGVIPDERQHVRLDQGRVPALLQQRPEGSGRAGRRACAPAGSCSPTCCARSPASAQRLRGRPAGRRHDARAAGPVPAGSIYADGRPAARPGPAARQRPAHRRERHGDDRRRRGGAGRSDVPRRRFTDPAEGRRVSDHGARGLIATAASPRPCSWRSTCWSGTNVKASRAALHKYCLEALRLQPQGEVLLRKCARDGVAHRATAARSPRARPSSSLTAGRCGTCPSPTRSSSTGRASTTCSTGGRRHTCLGQYVSPVIIVESMIALLGLQDLRRPEPRAGEPAFPLERRFGRLQLDDQNLYATTFSLRFTDSGTTQQFWLRAGSDVGVISRSSRISRCPSMAGPRCRFLCGHGRCGRVRPCARRDDGR